MAEEPEAPSPHALSVPGGPAAGPPRGRRHDLQWQWHNRGEIPGSRRGADVRAERAWSRTLGRCTRIAVIDARFDVTVPALAPRIAAWSGRFNADGTFLQGLGQIASDAASPHGTPCAALAAAAPSDCLGGSGIAPAAELLLLSIPLTNDNPQSAYLPLARAIQFASDPSSVVPALSPSKGADVIVCPLGPYPTSSLPTTLRTALNATRRGRDGLGVPVFFPVANTSGSVANDPLASNANVVAVGASDWKDEPHAHATGDALQFVAPGVDVWTWHPGGRFAPDTGTSFACGVAGGIAALALSVFPGLARDRLVQVLRDTCDKIGTAPYVQGRNAKCGFGRLNAGRAVWRAEFDRAH